MSQTSTSAVSPAFGDSEVRLELAIDIAGLGVFDFDLATDHLHWSARASEIYGGDSAELGAWRTWVSHVHPDDRSEVLAFRQALDNNSALEGEAAFRFRRPDGEERWITKRCRVCRSGAGLAVRACGVIVDKTEGWRADMRNRQLAFELQHRINSTLRFVRSLSKRTIQTSKALEDYDAHFDGRLDALSRILSMIARRLSHGVDVDEIVREEFLHHAAGNDHRVRIDGPSVLLGGKQAEYLALAIHELAVNAVKFGALSNRLGQVFVTWRLDEAGAILTLEWTEQGVPIVATNFLSEGFGRELIEQGLPYQLGASTTFNLARGGAQCTLRIPLPAGAGG